MGRESSSEASTGPGPALARAVFPEGSWFEALGEAVAADAEMAVIGRWCTLDLTLVADEETEEKIDTATCPVHLLTGEYDYACTPEESAATAAAIPDAKFTKMRGIGHFPMAENYPRFREHLLPILRELEGLLDGP
jgi:pimeloyl-ACP methyl ester carboxylesterase